MTKTMVQIILWLLSFLSGIMAVYPEFFPSLKYRVLAGMATFLLLVLSFVLEKAWTVIQYLHKRFELYRIRKKRIRIGISLDVDENDQIVSYCNSEIASMNLSGKIVFEGINTNKRTIEKFSKMVDKDKYDVIVWTEKLPQNGKVPLYFSYKNTADNRIAKIVHFFIHDIQMQERAFRIQKESLVVDLKLEKSNITYASLYIVAICATFFRGIDEGINVFEKLWESIKGSRVFISREINLKLKDLYTIKGVELCKSNNFKDAEIFLDKAFDLDPKDQNLLSALTITKYHLGKMDESEEHALSLLQNYPLNEVAHLNVAFFKVRAKKYPNALKHYKRFLNRKPSKTVCEDAILFLNNIIDQVPTEYGYLFGLSFVKSIIAKKDEKLLGSTYIQDYKSFILHTTGIIEYKDMFDYSNRIISTI